MINRTEAIAKRASQTHKGFVKGNYSLVQIGTKEIENLQGVVEILPEFKHAVTGSGSIVPIVVNQEGIEGKLQDNHVVDIFGSDSDFPTTQGIFNGKVYEVPNVQNTFLENGGNSGKPLTVKRG